MSPLLLEYDLRHERQYLLHNELSSQLSTTFFFETVYNPLLVADGRQRLPANMEFQPKYRDGRGAPEIYEADFEVDPQFLSFEDEAVFEIAGHAGVQGPGKAGRQYLAKYLGPKRETGVPIPLINLAIPTTDPKKLKAKGGGNKILTAARGFPAQLGIDPTLHAANNNFPQLAPYAEQPCQPTRSILAMALALCTKFRLEQKRYLRNTWMRFRKRQMPSRRLS